jgi:hypothetical protein
MEVAMPLPQIEEYPPATATASVRFGDAAARRPEHGVVRLVCPADGWTFYPPNLAATVVLEHRAAWCC